MIGGTRGWVSNGFGAGGEAKRARFRLGFGFETGEEAALTR